LKQVYKASLYTTRDYSDVTRAADPLAAVTLIDLFIQAAMQRP